MKKKRILIFTDQYIFVLNNNNHAVRFRDSYINLLGFTASLRIGASNFILHFKQRADEEFVCAQRDQLLQVVATQYVAAAEGKENLAIFGIASASLSDYVTSEKDIARNICRMPPNEYLITGKLPFGTGRASMNEPGVSMAMSNGEDNFEEDDMFDDFVVLDKPEIFQKYNPKYNTK